MSFRRSFIPLIWTVSAIFGSVACAGETGSLQAGIAKEDITPDPKMLNWTAPAPQPYGSVHDPLFARAFVLSDGDAKLVIIVWDLLVARDFSVARMRTAINRATGIAEDHIVISETHNHSGPKSEMGTDRALQRGREGEAQLHCTVLDGGALDCAKGSEPPGGGFGNAALRVSRSLRHAAVRRDGADATGTPVNLRVVFRIADDRRG